LCCTTTCTGYASRLNDIGRAILHSFSATAGSSCRDSACADGIYAACSTAARLSSGASSLAAADLSASTSELAGLIEQTPRALGRAMKAVMKHGAVQSRTAWLPREARLYSGWDSTSRSALVELIGLQAATDEVLNRRLSITLVLSRTVTSWLTLPGAACCASSVGRARSRTCSRGRGDNAERASFRTLSGGHVGPMTQAPAHDAINRRVPRAKTGAEAHTTRAPRSRGSLPRASSTPPCRSWPTCELTSLTLEAGAP
jgi:hypothetical protein